MKIIRIDGLGEVTVVKRAGQKNLAARVRPDGTVRVSIPTWAPYRSAVPLCLKHMETLQKSQSERKFTPRDGGLIGRDHKFVFRPDLTRSKIHNGEIILGLKKADDHAQKSRKLAIEALRKETVARVIPRVHELAALQGAKPRSIKTKNMVSRWGSCTTNGDLNFSIYCAQLDDRLLDYVIVHELSHLKHLNHSRDFWNEVEQFEPNYKSLRNELKQLTPSIRVR